MAHYSAHAETSRAEKDRAPEYFRRFAFYLLTLFIFIGPAPGQLFDKHSPWLREWIMFAGVGAGIPKGTFIVQHIDGTETEYTPLEAAGLDRYPIILHYRFEGRIFKTEHFGIFAQYLCTQTPQTSEVSFKGVVGTTEGWWPAHVSDICNSDKGEKQ